MTGQLGFLGLMLLELALLAIVLIVLHDLATHLVPHSAILSFCLAVLLLGVLGYLTFWLAYASYQAFTVVKPIALAAALISFAVLAYRGRLATHLATLAEPLAFTLLFCAIILTLGFANGGLDAPDITAQNRFSSSYPPDNIIPLAMAEMLRQGRLISPMFGDWLSSDRPPLQTGLYLLLSLQARGLGYQIVASLLQATFLIGLWTLLAATALPMAARRLVLLACCVLPVAVQNTFYTWPKLLSVGYLLMIFALLFCHAPKGAREQGLIGVLLGGLAALAVLSHGTAAFALIGLAAIVLFAWQWPSSRTVAVAALTLACLYAPWALYQGFIDPPGNRLLKWHLAGVIPVDGRSFFEALHDTYAALSWADYVSGRVTNFWVMVGDWPENLRDLALFLTGQNSDLARFLRRDDVFNFLPALHGFSLALTAALVLLPGMTAWPRQRRIVLMLFATVLVTCAVCGVLLIIPGSAINHQSSYLVQVMATAGAITVLALRVPILALAFVALQTLSVAALYAFTLPANPDFLPSMMACALATIALYAYALAPWFGAKPDSDAATAAR